MPEEIKWLWDNMFCREKLTSVVWTFKDGVYYISNIPSDYVTYVDYICEITKDKYKINMEVVL